MAIHFATVWMKHYPPAMKNWRVEFLVIVFALLILFLPLPAYGTVPAEHHLRIEASMFQFTPAEIYLNPGDRVTIDLVATDVVHGLSLDGYAFELTANPGQTTTGTFVADKPGVFRFRCLVPCGNLHPFMIGKLQVGTNTLFWRALVLGALAAALGIWSVRK